MRIAVASDHAGVALKHTIAEHLKDRGFDVIDLGCDGTEGAVDYPDYGAAIGREVAHGDADLGVAICGTGVGDLQSRPTRSLASGRPTRPT